MILLVCTYSKACGYFYYFCSVHSNVNLCHRFFVHMFEFLYILKFEFLSKRLKVNPWLYILLGAMSENNFVWGVGVKKVGNTWLKGYEYKQGTQATRSFQQFICISKSKIAFALFPLSQQTLTSCA